MEIAQEGYDRTGIFAPKALSKGTALLLTFKVIILI